MQTRHGSWWGSASSRGSGTVFGRTRGGCVYRRCFCQLGNFRNPVRFGCQVIQFRFRRRGEDSPDVVRQLSHEESLEHRLPVRIQILHVLKEFRRFPVAQTVQIEEFLVLLGLGFSESGDESGFDFVIWLTRWIEDDILDSVSRGVVQSLDDVVELGLLCCNLRMPRRKNGLDLFEPDFGISWPEARQLHGGGVYLGSWQVLQGCCESLDVVGFQRHCVRTRGHQFSGWCSTLNEYALVFSTRAFIQLRMMQ